MSLHETEIQELVDRIAQSEALSRSPRLVHLLRHIVLKTNAGDLAELSEQKIGVQLFGRPADYSPAEDNIVRAHARLLRQKLEQYFAEEGRYEQWTLSIPKGRYTAVIEPAIKPDTSQPQTSETLSALPPPRRSAWRLLGPVLAALVVGAFLGRLVPNPPSREHPLWSEVFQSERPALLVAADSGLVMYENLTHRNVELNEYAQRRHLSPNPNGLSPLPFMLGARRYTSFTDLQLFSRLTQLPQTSNGRVRIAFARDLSPADFKQANAVISGACEANPWLELLRDRLNFGIEKDQTADTFTIRIRHPAANEPPVITYNPSDDSQHAYAQLAFLPARDNAGNTLVIAGTTTAGTEAAADFVLNDSTLLPVLARAGRIRGHQQGFELLLRTRNIAGSAPSAEIAAARYGDSVR